MGLVYLMFCGEFLLLIRLTLQRLVRELILLLRLLRSDPQALNDFLHGTNEVTEASQTIN